MIHEDDEDEKIARRRSKAFYRHSGSHTTTTTSPTQDRTSQTFMSGEFTENFSDKDSDEDETFDTDDFVFTDKNANHYVTGSSSSNNHTMGNKRKSAVACATDTDDVNHNPLLSLDIVIENTVERRLPNNPNKTYTVCNSLWRIQWIINRIYIDFCN
jgi:hypothetical protein